MIEITKDLKDRIRAHEGCVLEPYDDSLGKLTVGIGHLVQAHERKRFQVLVQGDRFPQLKVLLKQKRQKQN